MHCALCTTCNRLCLQDQYISGPVLLQCAVHNQQWWCARPIYIWAGIAGSKAATSKPPLSPSHLQRTFSSARDAWTNHLWSIYNERYGQIQRIYVSDSPSYLQQTLSSAREADKRLTLCHRLCHKNIETSVPLTMNILISENSGILIRTRYKGYDCILPDMWQEKKPTNKLVGLSFCNYGDCQHIQDLIHLHFNPSTYYKQHEHNGQECESLGTKDFIFVYSCFWSEWYSSSSPS